MNGYRTYLRALLPLIGLPCGLAAQAPGALIGRTLDFTSDAAIVAARIELLNTQLRRVATAIADSAGRFRFSQVPPGAYQLRAQSLGYREVLTQSVTVPANETLDVVVRLSADAVPLAPLEIVAGAPARRGSMVLAGFRERAALKLGGSFIHKGEIELRNPRDVTDLLATVPGVIVVNTVLAMNRSQCQPTVYLDGVRVFAPVATGRSGAMSESRHTPGGAFEAVNLVHPRDIEGIEVYQGAATVPAEFSGSTARCGVVAIWTRRGGD